MEQIPHPHRIQRSAYPKMGVSFHYLRIGVRDNVVNLPCTNASLRFLQFELGRSSDISDSDTFPRFVAYLTLAISLQDLPKSRICLSLCSSSAVHGVLVLPFFLGGVSTIPPEISDMTGATTADPGIAEIPAAAVVADGGERLFLGFTCCCC